MKRSFLLYIGMFLVLAFSGFAAPEKPLDAEGMSLAQVIGIDAEGDKIRLSVCTAGAEPDRLSSVGESIPDAMRTLDEKSVGSGILYAHVSAVFIGEELCGQGIENFLEYFCLSDQVRMDIPVYIIRSGSAADAIATGSDTVGSGELAENLRERAELTGSGTAPTVSELRQTLLHSGSGIARALRVEPAADADGSVLSNAGLCLIRSGVSAGFLEEGDVSAVELLTGEKSIYHLRLRDRNGVGVSLEINGGRSRLRPEWDSDGALSALEIGIKLSARLTDGSADDFLGGEAEIQRLIERNMAYRAESVLRRCRSTGTDFLGLGQKAEMAAPVSFGKMKGSFGAALGSAEIRLTVRSEIKN